MKRLIATALIALLPTGAMAFDDRDAAQVAKAANSYANAFKAGRYEQTLKTRPPKLLDYFADLLNTNRNGLIKDMAGQAKALMADVTVHSVAMNTDAAVTGDTSLGAYAFVPTTTVMSAPGKGQKAIDSQTLVMQAGNRWYVVPLETPQIYDALKEAYPEFGAVPLP